MKQFLTKKRILAGVIVLVVVLLGAGVVYAANTWDQITRNQMDLFNQTFAPEPDSTPTAEPSPNETVQPTGTPGEATPEPSDTPAPTATIDPEEDARNNADMSLLKDTLHVLLVGVDYAEERQTWQKNFNSDVMLLLSINFKQNKVDMISFPRDTYAKIANINSTGINSFYKLNFSLYAGGGINDKGFMNVCKSVEGILGDKRIPPVNYYIAVTMPAVKDLVNAVGGVNYNVDIDFKIQGREYKKGMQLMNGQAVLDYCRVRKNSGTGYISEDGGDLNRVNRQKNMLKAVFKKLQTEASLFDVPRILTSMKDKVFTNMDYKQLAALALFGKDLPEDRITMRTLPNDGTVSLFEGWSMVLQNQAKRIAMLKELYGVTVQPLYRYDATFAHLQWAYMQGETWLKEIARVRKADAAKPVEEQKLTNTAKNEELDMMIAYTQKLMTKYHSRLFKDTKPVVTKAEWTELSSQANKMKELAQDIFYKAGYKADWGNYDIPEIMDMRE